MRGEHEWSSLSPLTLHYQEGKGAPRRCSSLLWIQRQTQEKEEGKKTRKGQDKNVKKGGGRRVHANKGQRRQERQRQGGLTSEGFSLCRMTSSWSWGTTPQTTLSWKHVFPMLLLIDDLLNTMPIPKLFLRK